MSVSLHEDWGRASLPAITEDSKMSTVVAHQSTLLTPSFSSPALSVGSRPSRANSTSNGNGNGNASARLRAPSSSPRDSVGDAEDGPIATAAAAAMLQKSGSNGLHAMSMRRRRFHSQELLFKTGNAAYASSTARGGGESPTLPLRGWMSAGPSTGSGANGIGNGNGDAALASSASYGELVSPADRIRQRQRRRALSDANGNGNGNGNANANGNATNNGTSNGKSAPTSDSFVIGTLRDDRGDARLPLSRLRRVGSIQEEALLHEDEDGVAFAVVSSDVDSESEIESESDTAPSATRSRRASGDSDISSSSSFYSNTVSRSHGSVDYEPEGMEKLLNLQKLYQEGFITVTEYKDRRLQLVDEMTVTDRTIHNTNELIETSMPVVYREPPEFVLLRERDAIKHVFDSEHRKWTSSRIKVKIDSHPFARGGLRQVFHLQDLSVAPQLAPDGRPMSYVAKIAMDPNENPDTYFRDVEMQAVAAKFAKLYNSYNPPRRVEFLEAWIMQLVPSNVDVDDVTMRGTMCGVEPFIAGEYHKHNNNFGFVSELERNTPQAFSHFTYEASGRQILVVDIQGVGDHYTDPQIHTRSGKEFGKGNMSVRGFERFLASHRCNPICRYLKLPLINFKDDSNGGPEGRAGADPKGTVPAQTYMSQPRICVKRVDTELHHYYGDSKAFQKYQAGRQHKHPTPRADLGSSSAFVTSATEFKHCGAMCGLSDCILS